MHFTKLIEHNHTFNVVSSLAQLLSRKRYSENHIDQPMTCIYLEKFILQVYNINPWTTWSFKSKGTEDDEGKAERQNKEQSGKIIVGIRHVMGPLDVEK